MACELAPTEDKPSANPVWRESPMRGGQAGSIPQPFVNHKPDRCFYLDFAGFSRAYSYRVPGEVLVVADRMTCPYLTVEFKKDNVSDVKAQQQVAAFGPRALYNR